MIARSETVKRILRFSSPSFSSPPLLRLLRLSLLSICPTNSTKLLHLHHSTVAAPLGISRCSFVSTEKFSLSLRETAREKEGKKKEWMNEWMNERREGGSVWWRKGVNDELLFTIEYDRRKNVSTEKCQYEMAHFLTLDSNYLDYSSSLNISNLL